MIYIEECFRNFKRSDKYTIGGELRTLFNDFLIKVSTFNDRPESEKAAFCDELLKDLDKCQIKMTLSQELSVFKSYKSWYHAAEMLFPPGLKAAGIRTLAGPDFLIIIL